MPTRSDQQTPPPSATRRSSGQLRQRIEDFFDRLDWDVLCRKRKRGYTISCSGCYEPFLRLRPTGRGDEVEVLWWGGDRWREVTGYGLILPLDDALEHVREDPHGVFSTRHETGCDLESFRPDSSPSSDRLNEVAFSVHGYFLIPTVLGGAGGGLFHGGWFGLAGAAAGGYLLACLLLLLEERRLNWALVRVACCCLPIAVMAGTGGLLGGTVNEALGGGIWGTAAGGAVGAIGGLAIFTGGWTTWLVGFLAGLNLGLLLSAAVGLHGHFAGTAAAALLAAGSASLFQRTADQYRAWSAPRVTAYAEQQLAERRSRRTRSNTTTA